MIDDNEIKTNQEHFYVDSFRPGDAEGLVSLFREVYGDGYPIRLFYDPEAVIAANNDGRYISIIARTHTGKVIGAGHLYRSAPYSSLYENGVALVLKEYRNTRAFKELLSYQLNKYVPQNPHIEEIWGEAVCNHLISQKMMSPFMVIETALEVALMPAETYSQEKSAVGRVATLDAFRCYVSRPHRIFLPQAYENILRRIYVRLDDTRDIVLSETTAPNAASTKIDMTVFDLARVARIAAPILGNDFAARFSELEDQARVKNVIVFQVWLNLAEPWVGQAVDILRSQGYFFGGALPRWFDNDGLLMQKLECPPDFDNIMLLSDFSKELLNFIREDREHVLSARHDK